MKFILPGLFVLVLIFLLFSSKANRKREYRYNEKLKFIKENCPGNRMIDGAFINSDSSALPSLFTVLKWKLSRNPQAKEKKEENFKLPLVELKSLPEGDDYLIWLGHSTFYISIGGVKIITDPNFYDILMVRRLSKLPLPVERVRPLDYVIVSHDHRDHFDTKSIEELSKQNPQVEVLLPLNANRLFKSKVMRTIKTQEAAWYQEYQLEKDIRIVFLPAVHWGRRGLNDTNKTLWGSFIIIKNDFKIYFAGDSKYSSTMYKEIGELFSCIDLCLMPIAAYSPSYMMKEAHMNPEEAYQAFKDLRGKRFIPMHYGTYDLSDEPLSEPLARIKSCFKQQKESENLIAPAVGELVELRN